MTAAIDVVEFRFCDGVVDIDGGEEEGASSSHFVQSFDSGGGLFRHADHLFGHSGPFGGILGEAFLDNAQNELEFQVVGGGGVG